MKRHLRSVAIIALCICTGLSTGCDDSPDDASDAPAEPGTDEAYETEFPRDDLNCNDDGAAAISDWLTETATWKDRYSRVQATDLPVVDGPEVDEPVVTIHLDGHDLRIDGRLVLTADELDAPNSGHRLATRLFDAFDESRQRAQIRGDDATSAFGVAISDDVDTQQAIELFDRLEQNTNFGQLPAYVLFEAPWPAGVEPLPAEVQKQLHELRPASDNRQRLGLDPLAEAAAEATADCAPLRQFGGELVNVPPQDRLLKLADRLGELWLECDCQVDIEFFLAYELRSDTDNPPASYAIVEHTPDDDDARYHLRHGDGDTIPITGDGPWTELLPETVDRLHDIPSEMAGIAGGPEGAPPAVEGVDSVHPLDYEALEDGPLENLEVD